MSQKSGCSDVPRLTHPHEDTVYACPECDSANDLYRRENEGGRNACLGRGHPCVCYDCGASFDTPNTRPPKENPVRSASVTDGMHNVPEHIVEKIEALKQ